MVFLFSINVANFEAFLWRIKLTKNLWFLKSIRRRMKIESHSIIINVIELFVFLWPNLCPLDIASHLPNECPAGGLLSSVHFKVWWCKKEAIQIDFFTLYLLSSFITCVFPMTKHRERWKHHLVYYMVP